MKMFFRKTRLSVCVKRSERLQPRAGLSTSLPGRINHTPGSPIPTNVLFSIVAFLAAQIEIGSTGRSPGRVETTRLFRAVMSYDSYLAKEHGSPLRPSMNRFGSVEPPENAAPELSIKAFASIRTRLPPP